MPPPLGDGQGRHHISPEMHIAPTDAAAFDELAGMLRQTEEWTYVEREVEIRLSRRLGL